MSQNNLRDKACKEYMHSYKGTDQENNSDAFSGFMAGWTAAEKASSEDVEVLIKALEYYKDKILDIVEGRANLIFHSENENSPSMPFFEGEIYCLGAHASQALAIYKMRKGIK